MVGSSTIDKIFNIYEKHAKKIKTLKNINKLLVLGLLDFQNLWLTMVCVAQRQHVIVSRVEPGHLDGQIVGFATTVHKVHAV